MNLEEYEKLVPNAQAAGLTFLTPNQHVAWRVQTLFTKEPDTIEWMRKFEPGQTLFDVGANIGQYSMLAAKAGVNVHAFEPEAQNFALLVRNLAVNASLLGGRCVAWPVALSDHAALDIMHLSGMIAGGSCHAFADSVDFHGKPKDFPYSQGSISTTLDIFAAKYGPPDHIKIDVDGFEHLVIRGGNVVLNRARSVLIEINTSYPEHMDFILPRMAELGYHFDEKQAFESRRKEGPFTGVGNIIFYRD
jgi:FkbM family methyltransferase